MYKKGVWYIMTPTIFSVSDVHEKEIYPKITEYFKAAAKKNNTSYLKAIIKGGICSLFQVIKLYELYIQKLGLTKDWTEYLTFINNPKLTEQILNAYIFIENLDYIFLEVMDPDGDYEREKR